MELKSVQRAFLRSRAQSLEPVVYVGKDGVSSGVINALDMALENHELVKVRFSSNKEEIEELSKTLEEKTESNIIAITGFTSVFFRQDNKNPERKYKI